MKKVRGSEKCTQIWRKCVSLNYTNLRKVLEFEKHEFLHKFQKVHGFGKIRGFENICEFERKSRLWEKAHGLDESTWIWASIGRAITKADQNPRLGTILFQ